MTMQSFGERAAALAEKADALAGEAESLAYESAAALTQTAGPATAGTDPFIMALTVFVLAVIIGYYVVWGVTPALHSPLMAVTNAISSVIIVGALLAAGPAEINIAAFDINAVGDIGIAPLLGFFAIILASVNIFGGFIVSHRMLSMFKKKPRRAESE